MLHKFKYNAGRKFAAFLINRGKPLQSIFFSAIYQEFFEYFQKKAAYVKPEYARLDKLHRDKHAELTATLTKYMELREKHKELSKKYSKLIRESKKEVVDI